jgi:uncharacterized membrane protein
MSRFPWRTLLFLSVALNLLVLGSVAGALGAGVRLQREASESVVARMPGPRGFVRALPPDLRRTMRRELAESWTQSRELRRAANEARREAFTAAAQEPYDAERVRAAFARLREADQAAIAVFHDRVIDAFARLTPEQRAQALQALRTAAPARRQSIAPQEEENATSAPSATQEGAGEEIEQERRQRLREELRERRRERRELRRQKAP